VTVTAAGATLTATSVGITARVLGDLGRMATAEARIILGAAVIDDVLGLVILTVVSGIAAGGAFSPGSAAKILMVAVGFLVIAVAVGGWVAAALGPDVLRWVIGLSFIAMAAWMLVPDSIDDEAEGGTQRFGVFGTTVLAFFLAEMGDKTQIATVALAARYSDLVAVVAGTTLGMMIANVPAVLLGDVVAKKVPMRLVHGIAAAIFAVLGVLTLLNVGKLF